MPNHFHILVYVDEENIKLNNSGQMQVLQRKIGTLQSSYTRAINIQEGRVGSLFQSKFKAIELTMDHAITCFHYIHQNPVKANLCTSLSEWAYSSYREYERTNSFKLCDKGKAFDYLEIPEDVDKFRMDSSTVIVNEETIRALKQNK